MFTAEKTANPDITHNRPGSGNRHKMTTDPKPRATPIPQGYDRILKGALKLSLKERADIANALIAANKKELDTLAQQLLDGQAAMNGTQQPGS